MRTSPLTVAPVISTRRRTSARRNSSDPPIEVSHAFSTVRRDLTRLTLPSMRARSMRKSSVKTERAASMLDPMRASRRSIVS